MGYLITQDVGSVLDHYADVIEGGNTHNSGTAFEGIPGAYSHNDRLFSFSYDDPQEDPATVAYGSGDTGYTDGYVGSSILPMFLLCTSASDDQNDQAARKIISHDSANRTFTTRAFPVESSTGDTFSVLDGFRRAPDTVDIEDDDGPASTMDRFYRLDIEDEGEDLGIYGKSVATYRTRLRLRVRFTKDGRDEYVRKKVWTNMTLLRRGLLQSGQGDSTYVRCLLPTGTTRTITEDKHKIVAGLEFDLIYRLDTAML